MKPKMKNEDHPQEKFTKVLVLVRKKAENLNMPYAY